MTIHAITGWWNYATNQFDHRSLPPESDQEARMYIMQDETIQAVYDCYRTADGMDILSALLATLFEQLRMVQS